MQPFFSRAGFIVGMCSLNDAHYEMCNMNLCQYFQCSKLHWKSTQTSVANCYYCQKLVPSKNELGGTAAHDSLTCSLFEFSHSRGQGLDETSKAFKIIWFLFLSLHHRGLRTLTHVLGVLCGFIIDDDSNITGVFLNGNSLFLVFYQCWSCSSFYKLCYTCRQGRSVVVYGEGVMRFCVI